MGNCCGAEADKSNNFSSSKGAFHGQGNRLGTAEERERTTTTTTTVAPGQTTMSRQNNNNNDNNDNDNDDILLPKPIHDPNLTESMREKQRADRLAAAEARMKTQQPKKTNKVSTTTTPLRGPNSEPLMRWSAG